MTTVAIMQPTYLPWLGYFDMLDQADVFVLLDTVAVSRQSWQTRNRIRARDGNVVWLSIPVHSQLRDELSHVQMANGNWQTKHLRTIDSAYRAAPFGETVAALVCDALPWSSGRLASYTTALIHRLTGCLGVDSHVIRASHLGPMGTGPIDRLRDICRLTGATEYLSPEGARGYLEGHDIGVPVRWHDYEHPVYDQGGAEFMSHLSVVDLIAWNGPASMDIIRSGRR